MEAVTISWTEDIVSCTNYTLLNDKIQSAFGPTGLGLIVIKDYPDFQKERLALLHAIRQFALLPDEVKESYSRPECYYAMGWSHGKEKMKSGIPDTAKGSFYARPHGDVWTEDEELKQQYPETYADNKWPEKECPELGPCFKAMTAIQMNIGLEMCKLFDKYLNSITEGKHKDLTLYKLLTDSVSYKGRMLHYFPVQPECNAAIDGLCGWHLDHGVITLLMSPIYLNLQGEQIPAPEECGLYVKSPADGSINKIEIPDDCLALQCGETAQMFSGGLLRATPHCVRSCKNPEISREQMALFMDSEATTEMKIPEYGLSYEEVVNTPYLPEGVPELKARMEGVKTYRDFAANTFKAYLG